jgi:choline dehydrogenase
LFEGRRAVGIVYQRNGRQFVARASAEVILSGGAINSPQLLQLSGVGTGEHLSQFEIPVVVDLPGVGAELQDHFQVRFSYRCTDRITMNDTANSWRLAAQAAIQYAFTRRGFLAVGAGYAGGCFRTDQSGGTPDVQVHFIIFSADKLGAKLNAFPGFIASVCQLRPESRGFVRIKSPDPTRAPAIQPRYLSASRDCDTMAAGMKLLKFIMAQPAMRRYIAEERFPGANCVTAGDLLAYARATGTTIFHPTSTCRMGPDRNAVVDHRLKVYGIDHLRVVDASVMPTVVSGNTNAAVVMIAEKGAEMILQDACA